ncbi:MAG: formylmethanofuran dehydrogenase subunit C [Anaerolineae bacterium]
MDCTKSLGVIREGDENAITLRLKESSTIPIEADSITPDNVIGRSQAEIEKLPAFYGRREVALGDLFAVEGGDSANIVLEGDLSHVKRIGQRMSRGQVTIHSDVGPHLGSEMSGGEIVIHGDVGAWAGAQMSGGRIWVHGDAGPMLGAAYTGEKLGMRGGVIVVDGDAGSRAAERMRRGLIVVCGDVGEFAGARMIAGSLFSFGRLGARPGAGMKRGTLITLQELAGDVLPTFSYSCTCESPAFLRYYLHRLRAWGLPVTDEHVEGRYRRYTGDATTIGKGEVFVYDQRE